MLAQASLPPKAVETDLASASSFPARPPASTERFCLCWRGAVGAVGWRRRPAASNPLPRGARVGRPVGSSAWGLTPSSSARGFLRTPLRTGADRDPENAEILRTPHLTGSGRLWMAGDTSSVAAGAADEERGVLDSLVATTRRQWGHKIHEMMGTRRLLWAPMVERRRS
jgi:hypothetical protein